MFLCDVSYFMFVSLKHFAWVLAKEGESRGIKTDVVDLKDYDPEDNLTQEVSQQSVLSKYRVIRIPSGIIKNANFVYYQYIPITCMIKIIFGIRLYTRYR